MPSGLKRFQNTGDLPYLNYGLTTRQEVTFEILYMAQTGALGLGDATIGTRPGFATRVLSNRHR